MTRWSRKDKVLFSWTVIPVALYLLFFCIPVLMGINYSLTDWNGLTKTYNYKGLQNYVQLFTNTRLRNSLIFTGKYTVLLVIGVMLLAMILTLMITYVVSEKHRGFFRSVIFFPAVLSMVTIGLVFNQIMYRVLPQLGQNLNIGWLSKNLLGDPKTAIWGLLLVNIWQGTAIPFVILLAGIQNIPNDLYEAASLDGASAWTKFTKITIPFLLPTMNVAFIMVLKSGLTAFDLIKAMTDGGPMRTTESAGVLIYQLAFTDSKAALSSAYSVLLLLIIAVISFVNQKISKKIEVGQL